MPFTLDQYQATLKDLMLTEAGRHSLASGEALETFLAQRDIPDTLKAQFRQQPLDRLGQYQYMVCANIVEAFDNIFPLTKALLGDQWDTTVKAFFYGNPSQTYHFVDIAKPFVDFLEINPFDAYPFLHELALYEWIEAKLLSLPNHETEAQTTEPARLPTTVDEAQRLIPVLNKACDLLALEYDIPALVALLQAHQVLSDHPQAVLPAPQPVYVWVYRQRLAGSGPNINRHHYECRYFQLNPMLAQWLNDLRQAETATTYDDLTRPLFEAIATTGSADMTYDRFCTQLLGTLPALLDNQILLGSSTA
ncbi:MAG: putative DNA-binding domain-containing protein [Cyanobacteria bacterium HKST-UBA04]|nr:putative DNA-binding domain-containing protein [Cyanobacteria bacterium HKST-UBA04]